MNQKMINLASRLLEAVPKSDMAELVKILDYYNGRFAEGERTKAMKLGSSNPTDELMEGKVKQFMVICASQGINMISTSNVCPYCGK